MDPKEHLGKAETILGWGLEPQKSDTTEANSSKPLGKGWNQAGISSEFPGNAAALTWVEAEGALQKAAPHAGDGAGGRVHVGLQLHGAERELRRLARNRRHVVGKETLRGKNGNGTGEKKFWWVL